MAENKSESEIGQGARLKKLVKKAIVAVVLGVTLLILSIVTTFMTSLTQSEQLEVTMALNQYRNGSKTLTSEVQSYAITGEQEHYDNYMKELNDDKNRDEAIAILKKHDISDEEWAAFNEISSLSDGLVPLEEAALESAAKGNLKEAQESVFGDDYEETISEINEKTTNVINQIQQRKAKQKTSLQNIQIIFQVIFVIAIVYVLYCFVQTFRFAHKELLIPIKKVSEQIGYVAQGDFSQPIDLKEDKSEVGQMVYSINFMKKNMSEMIEEISQILGQMSDGNYKFEIEKQYVGEFVEIKDSIIKIAESMRDTLKVLRDVSDQINGGSEQLAYAAQELAEGSTTQATQVSEVAETIKRVTDNMSSNAVAAKESVEMASNAGKTLMVGNQKMEELKNAISDISKCSEEIGGIINTIDDIASQTNLLALNAAIEAARAGDAGKGFAVVAEQVKSLAEESAKAAGQTTELIQTTINAVNKGITIADDTAANMTEVTASAMEATQKMGQIAQMLDEEADHMKEVNLAVDSVSGVVDNNSATSEETAAVSEEQKAQVETMVDLMNRFKI